MKSIGSGVIVVLGFAFSLGTSRAEEPEFPLYVGRDVCLECHSPGHTVKPCAVRPVPEHDRAYEALARPEALEIAALSGIGEAPHDSRICLECHAASADVGPRWTADTFKIEHGVQCESCHNAGSFHVQTRRSAKHGTSSDAIGMITRGDLRVCVPCHMHKLSHLEVLENGFKRSPVDRLYRTPVNLAASPNGDRLYVVCEQGDSLIVVDLKTARVLDEIAVGKRPQDVAVSPDGRRLYVTNRMSGTLTVIDAASSKVVGEVRVGAEPHGVLTDATGTHIYVANTTQDSISIIDADQLTETKRLTVGGGPWSLALSPDGRSIYVTSVRPNVGRFRDPPRSEVTVIDVERGVVTSRPIADEANMLQGMAFVTGRNVALFTMMRTKSLLPITRIAQGWTITNGLGVVWPDGRIDQVLLDEPNAYFPDPWDVAVSPDGRYALVTSGGADEVAVVDIAGLLTTITAATDHQRQDVLPNHLGMSGRFVLKRIAVGSNPRGIEFSPDGRFAYVANALDDSVSIIDTADFSVTGAIKLGGPAEVTQIRHGAKVFHSADITFGRQFSCRSCHPDGHINGLPLDIEADGIGVLPVDNRTLRGIVDTSPFKWEGTNPSLHRQCGARLAVFFTRLAPYTPDDLDALVRYMCTIERPPNPYRSPEGLTLAQRRGKAVFDRRFANNGTPLTPQQRCVGCHYDAYKKSRLKTPIVNKMWFDAPVELDEFDLFDADAFGDLGVYYYVEVHAPPNVLDVPHLTNIYNSPPYLHNGAANTLEELWTRFNIKDDHGVTIDLTREQFNDLIAYLKAL
ncbi:MAG: beta-propeller fold lactonase family protein [Phycisphaerae bacterium]